MSLSGCESCWSSVPVTTQGCIRVAQQDSQPIALTALAYSRLCSPTIPCYHVGMTQPIKESTARAIARLGRFELGICRYPSCQRQVDPPRPSQPTIPQSHWYCSIRCAVLDGRRVRRLRRAAAAARSVARMVRFCHVCDNRIPADRLRRHHNARSCRDECSVQLRAEQKRQAIGRYKRRLSTRRRQDRAAALVDTAECAVETCRQEIPAERRVRWPNAVTCSTTCTREHQKHLVKLAKRRQRERQKEAA